MIKQASTLLLLITAALLSACASTGSVPAWVSGQDSRYPHEAYLTGTGHGSSVDLAKDHARADLAKAFEVSISEQTRDVQTFKRETNGDETKTEANLDVSRQIATRTEKVVRGIEIADVWQDPDTRTFNALAVINRRKAARSLEQEIMELDQATLRFVEQSRAETDSLRKVAAAMRALEAAMVRVGLNHSLNVLDLSGRGRTAEFDVPQLKADVDELLARLVIMVKCDGAQAEELSRTLAGALSGAGFSVIEDERANYVLKGRLDLYDLGLREGWYWVRGTLEVVLRDQQGAVRVDKRWEVKASGQQSETANHRVMDRIAGILKEDLRNTILHAAMTDE